MQRPKLRLALMLLVFTALDGAAQGLLLALHLGGGGIQLRLLVAQDFVALRDPGEVLLQPRHVALEAQLG